MTSVNRITEKLLAPLRSEGVRVCYQYPEDFGTLPAVAYYDLITTESFRADNSEQAQLSRVQIDIWAMKKTQPGEIAEKVNRIMQDNGWIRELGRDLPKGAKNHVYHYTMRFAKEIYG